MKVRDEQWHQLNASVSHCSVNRESSYAGNNVKTKNSTQIPVIKIELQMKLK